MKADKFIALCGYCSRRKAYDLVKGGLVTVNGKKATFSTRIEKGDKVLVENTRLVFKEIKPIIIAFNKPKGIICTTEKISGNIIEAVNHPQKIYPVGRLDKNSEGLILLTNQTALIDKISNPKFVHEKEYLVTLNLPVRKKFLEEISAGIKLGDEQTKPCKAWMEPGTKRVFRIVLTQGLNRQIRRMCSAYDYQVIKLQRVRVMHIELGKLKTGEWRNLSGDELSILLKETDTVLSGLFF